MAKIGIYGGSFNPPHKGHVFGAREFADQLGLDKLIVVPNAAPPHKAFPEGTPTPLQRLAMVRLAFSDDPRFCVSDLELSREGKSFTSDTIRQIKDRHPDDELYFMMGTDMFLSFETWHDPGAICKNAALVCLHREKNQKTAEALRNQAEKYRTQFGANAMVLQNSFLEMSSTDVRRLLRFGCAEEYLSEKVLQYIQENKLYGVSENWRDLPFEKLREKSLSLHNESRKAHAIGCSELAKKLAKRFGLSEQTAYRAGILHDVTKALPPHAQYAMCRHYHVKLSGQEQQNAKLLHAITGAVAAQTLFGESQEVCRAIRWHTTGHAGMTTMEKILYIADYAEENRDFPGVEELRTMLDDDLDRAVAFGIKMTIDGLKEKNQPICDNTLAAYSYITGERI